MNMTFTKEEWWEVCQKAAPGLTREGFEKHWIEFHEWQEKRDAVRAQLRVIKGGLDE